MLVIRADRPAGAGGWRVLADRLLVFYDSSVVWLDPKDGKVLEEHAYAPGARLPYYDSALVRFRVRGTRCRTTAVYEMVLQNCGGLLLMYSPSGFVLAFDEATGKLVETLTAFENVSLGLHRGRAGASLCVFLPSAVSVTALDPETGEEIALERLDKTG